MLELRGLSFAYPGGQTVLHDVDLSLPERGHLALVGENGSGKSTLLKLIAGVLPAPKGTVWLDGRPMMRGRGAVGYVGQVLLFDRDFPITVAEVVFDGLFGLRLRGHDADKRVRACLDTVGLAHLEQRPFALLSGGQRQRALIARALVSEPSLLLLDEPTSGLDSAASEALLDTLTCVGEGRTLVFATHRGQVLRRLADWRLLLPEQCLLRGGG